jgi:hypothetical protein
MSTAVSDLSIPKVSQEKSLFSPLTDFLLLGGGSIFGLFVLRMLFTGESGQMQSYVITFALANIINHPHFAYSYQIFYRNFHKKITSYPKDLRLRYIISGIVVPLALVAFFAVTVLFEMPRILGFAANLMFFSVGWHYVKQGYGMAMMDAVLKKAFYTEQEKKALLHNAFSTWIFSWCLINYLIDKPDPKYFEISYFAVPVSIYVLIIAGAVCAFTFIKLFNLLRQRAVEGRKTAWNGLIAYAVSLYAWLLIRDPIVLLWVPMFHSLQYLTVVWRFEVNRSRSISSDIKPSLRFGLFIAIGLALGYIAFWLLPEWLNANINYSKEIFGTSLFLFLFWIFINIHHYFLDTVMWRKGNPDVQTHLFSHGH